MRSQIRSRSPATALGLVPFLAMLSGACGLAYEVIFVRLFSNYFGNGFAITGVTLCAVFLGISFGAWQSARFLRWLALIEIGIGLYAFAAATAFSRWGFEIVGFAADPWVNAIKLSVFLGVPAFMIGTCVPLFSAYIRGSTGGKARNFTMIYGLYNFGAFLSVLVIEFALFRHLGLRATSYVVGCLNLFIGITLVLARLQPSLPPTHATAQPIASRAALALFLASFASGIFQLFVLRLSFSIFGPLHENFAIILASAILGVAIGAWGALRFGLRLETVLAWLAVLMLAFLIFVPALIDIWSRLSGNLLGDAGEIGLKILLLAGFPLGLFIMFGTLVPLTLATFGEEQPRLSGRILAISSLGNGLGSLAMFLVLYRHLDLPEIGILLAGILLLASWIAVKVKPTSTATFGTVLIGACLIYAGVHGWPRTELLLGYRSLMHADEIALYKRNYEDVILYKAYDQSAALVRFSDGNSALVLNGYRSLSFGPYNKSELHEVIVGSSPVLFSKNTDRALVFGLGSGITGGATARFYDHTKIVEINPAMLEMPKHFLRENQNVMERENVEVALEDGISTLLAGSERYDAIVNTVTSPQYYSASKLYTKDFYDIVKSRLASGGVYSGWFDVNIDREGIAIMLNTLEKSFANCRYFLLQRGYFNAVCADGPLVYRSSPDVSTRISGSGLEELFESYQFSGGFLHNMTAFELEFSPRFMERSSELINTLDHPAIEFVIARESDASETIDVLADMIAENINFQRQAAFSGQGWRENCRIISQMSGLEFAGC